MKIFGLLQLCMTLFFALTGDVYAQSKFLPSQDIQLTGFNWNSSYWPFMKGGLNHRTRHDCKRKLDCLSPAEKMDFITDGQFYFSKNLQREENRTRLLDRFWTGRVLL